MKTFVGIMCLIMITTCLVWHNYTNVDIKIYTEKRKLFIAVILTEFITTLGVFAIALMWS